MEKENFVNTLEKNDLAVGVLVAIFSLALIYLSMYFS